MRIEKKIWPGSFEKILAGEKTFEVRLADWSCKAGDVLVLREWNPKTKQYTGRQMERKVTYVVKTKELPPYWPQEEIDKYGLQVIGFK